MKNRKKEVLKLFSKKALNILIVTCALITGCSSNTTTKNLEVTAVNLVEQPSKTQLCESIENESERELCTLTAIGYLLQNNALSENDCKVITNVQNQADCFSYLSETSHRLDYCFNINDISLRDSCFGDAKRIFKPETIIESEALCEMFDKANKWLWANQCRLSYVLKHEVLDAKKCDKITYPLAFYNCVKNIAYFNEDASICVKINEKLPFPKNYPPLVFSESGCKYWVENKRSYKGLELK
ncbi:MAG: hypothetical protein CMF61_02110 [Magnetococcales bacterium]|nr:hypothetical protein [Magnetococcales bacterium]